MNEQTTHHYIPLDEAMPRPGPLLRWLGGAIALAAMLGAVAIALTSFLVGLALWPLMMAWTWLARRSVPTASAPESASAVEAKKDTITASDTPVE